MWKQLFMDRLNSKRSVSGRLPEKKAEIPWITGTREQLDDVHSRSLTPSGNYTWLTRSYGVQGEGAHIRFTELSFGESDLRIFDTFEELLEYLFARSERASKGRRYNYFVTDLDFRKKEYASVRDDWTVEFNDALWRARYAIYCGSLTVDKVNKIDICTLTSERARRAALDSTEKHWCRSYELYFHPVRLTDLL